jgi:hypothetical protein
LRHFNYLYGRIVDLRNRLAGSSAAVCPSRFTCSFRANLSESPVKKAFFAISCGYQAPKAVFVDLFGHRSPLALAIVVLCGLEI